ncbi:MAG: threonylcarbamoyl-AMP synthase [Alphaproteobacteria bacterium]|nr:threonylcarbamoyl-AMP synthase [Alphaproteobacteria bacterium]
MPRIVIASPDAIAEAANLLKAGEVVAIPTETVYGLAANALDDEAVAKIFKAKSRPAHNPLIVHIADIDQAENFVHITPLPRKIMNAFWPGALTIILPQKENSGISKLLSAELGTLALRMPAHKTARALLKATNLPLAAPSANASGEPSATTPRHVADSLGDNISFILADGACDIGLESTVLDLSDDVPTILRTGAITAQDLEPYAGNVMIDTGNKEKPKSPGQLLKHYAPKIPVRLNAVDVKPGEALLAFGSITFMGIEGGGSAKDLPESAYRNLSKDADLEEAARNLFTMLRDLDRPEHKTIAVMNIPDQGIGIAINERLGRAAEKQDIS